MQRSRSFNNGVSIACRVSDAYVPAMAQPLIGITMDVEEAGGYSRFPWLALRQNYAEAVSRAGGLPVLLPPDINNCQAYLGSIDGVIISGGNFDVDPSLFGATRRHPTVHTKDRRTAFELELTRALLSEDRPVLGICGGQQLLHVALGGSLIQHIPDEVPEALAHEQPNPRNQPGHSVNVTPGTRLHAVVETEILEVNSAHHQAVRDDANGVIVNARAPDGVIEGIEVPHRRFCIGVQWHPEFLITRGDEALFCALIQAASA